MLVTLLIILFTNFFTNGWEKLSNVSIRVVYDQWMEMEIDKLEFSDEVLALDGQEITLEGYIIPLEAKNVEMYFVLSQYPFQSCFFCGAAGPETVAEIYSLEDVRFTSGRVKVTGKLEINLDDPLHLPYKIKSAEVVYLP